MPGVEPTPRVEDEDEFRSRVRGFLVGHAAPRADAQHAATDVNVAHSKAFQAALFSEGLAGLTWPREYGGQGLPISYQSIFNEEAQNYDLPTRPFSITFGMAVPVILKHGSVEQKHQFVPPAIRGEEIWCQLFSEPSSGSDLASVRSTAVRDGDEWILNGQKVWTSLAQTADFGICLARTDPDAPKHAGITYFIVDMHVPGIDIRPLRELTGAAMFNEVFMTDVFVPDDAVIGQPGEGWRIGRTTLANERVSMSSGAAFGIGVESLIRTLARRQGPEMPPGFVGDLGHLLVEAQSIALMGLRATLRTLSGVDPGSGSSVRKLLGAEHEQRVQEMGMALYGADGAVLDGKAERWGQGFLSTRCLTIAGGTSEVQRNVIAERILGQPRDPEPGH
jgi:alkylation response protein AidB-like acyl-CoA dehydrogenase